jgi:hypothetical protein
MNDQWKTCSAEWCDRKARSKGATYCEMHYYRVRKTGTPGPAGLLPRIPPGICEVEDCPKTKRSSVNLYCEMHYCRLRRTGTLAATRMFPYPEVCLAEGCSRKPNSHGYCGMHATRIKRHGDPHIVIAVEDRQFLRGSAAPRWLPDDVVDYRTIHMRLRHFIGSARTMQCADCGERPAVHWSYDHQDPDERMTPDGVPYSIRPDHYQPRCASCHKFYDHAHLRREAVRKALAGLVAAAEEAGNIAAAEFARAHLETEWPRFREGVLVHLEDDRGGMRKFPSCSGQWLDYMPERGAA